MAIFKDTPDFKRHCPQIHKAFSWDELGPLSEQAQQLYVQDYLGEAFYSELETAYLSGSPSAEQAKAIDLLQKAIAYYTYTDLILSQSIHVATRGVQESVSDDSTSRPASHYAKNDARKHAANRADMYLDRLLQYLEESVIETNSLFTTWQSSEAYNSIFSSFIWSYESLTKYLQGIRSRRILFAIRAQIQWVQDRDLRPILSDAVFDDVISKIRTRPTTALSTELTSLIEKVRPWLATKAFLEAIPTLRLEYREGGIHFLSYDGPSSRQLSAANDSAIRNLMTQLEAKSDGAWATLVRWLDANADDYPGVVIQGEEGEDGYIYKPQVFDNPGSVSL
jgi:hypothetical protein